MRSESSCSKAKLVFHLSALLVLCLLLIGMTACGSTSEAGQSTDPETSTGNEAAVVTSDTSEKKTEQVNTTENNGKSIDQAPAATDTVPETIVPDDETRTENDDMKKLRMEINGTISKRRLQPGISSSTPAISSSYSMAPTPGHIRC